MFNPTEFKVSSDGSAHAHGSIYSSHTFDRIFNDPQLYPMAMKYTEPGLDPMDEQAIQWLRKNITFDASPVHIIRTHAANLDLLAQAVGDCKIINITVTDDDLDQLIYNFVIKTVIPNNHWWHHHGYKLVDSVRRYRPDLTDIITLEYIKDITQSKDIHQLCAIMKIFRRIGLKKYQEYQPEDKFDCYTIKWNNLKNLAISDLVEFVSAKNVDINLMKHSLDLYLNSQTTIPFNIVEQL